MLEMNAGGVNGNRGAAIKQVDADIFQYPPIAEQKSDIPDIPLVFEKIVVPFVSEHVEPDQVPEKLVQVVDRIGKVDDGGKVQLLL